MDIRKKIVIIIYVILFGLVTTDFCHAQKALLPENTSIPQEQKSEIKSEKTNPKSSFLEKLQEYEPPKEAEKEPLPSDIDDINPNKPNICGSITFDKTKKALPINIQKVLEIALANNFDIKIFFQRKESDRWLYYNSATELLPDITYTQLIQKNKGDFIVGDILNDDVDETVIESNFNFEYILSIHKFFNLMTFKNLYKAQKKQLEFTEAQVLKDTSVKYYELLGNKKGIEILETNLKQIEEQLRINNEKLEAGEGTKFDVLRAEADKARAEQALIVARNLYRFSQAQLANILGIPVLMELRPDDLDIKVETVFKKCFELEQAKNIAMKNRPDLKAAYFDILASKNLRNSGYSIYVPQLILRGQIAKQGTIGVYTGTNFVLAQSAFWEGGRGLGLRGFTDIKSLNAQLKETKLLYTNLSRDIEENLVAAFVETVADKDLIASTWTELQAASESRNLSVVRLREGIGTFIDVLQTQNTYTNAYINYIRAVLGYNISQIQLLFEMGVISADNIIEGYDYQTPTVSK